MTTSADGHDLVKGGDNVWSSRYC